MPLKLFWVSQRDAGAARKPEKARRMESKLSTERAFFSLSPEGKPSGWRPVAALPRRGESDKAACRACGIVEKHNLFPAAFVWCFVEPVA